MPPATKVNGCRPGVIGRGVSALALALGIAFAPTAQAFSPQPVLHLDASAAALGAALALPADAPAWRATPDALATACTAEPGGAIRIALLAGSVPRLRDADRATGLCSTGRG